MKKLIFPNTLNKTQGQRIYQSFED